MLSVYSVTQVSAALGEFGAPQHLSFLEDYVPGELSPQKGSAKVPRQDSREAEAERVAGEEEGKRNAEAEGR